MIAWVAAWRAGGHRMVPVLVTPDGAIDDSTAIMKWCDAHGDAPPLFPREALGAEIAALEDDLDERFGPEARRIAYGAVLPQRAAADALFEAVPRWQARLVGATYPLVKRQMTRMLHLTPERLARAYAVVDDVFAEIGRRVADGRRYLVGDRLSAADIAFASLSAPIVAPERYGGPLPPRSTWPADYTRYVDTMRATPAGRFALALYDER